MKAESPFETLYVAETSTLVVLGCLDELEVDAFRSAVRDASDDYRRDLVVDLSNVEFLPSCAISVLVGAVKSSSTDTLRLVARPGTIARRVLDICGFAVQDAADARVAVVTPTTTPLSPTSPSV